MEIDEHTNSQDEIMTLGASQDGDDAPPPGTPCVHRVSQVLLRLDPLAYAPQIISIGPFHHNNSSLDNMEYQKLRYVDSLMTRVHQSNLLENCYDSILAIENEVRGSYEGQTVLNRREFIETIVIDSLFIIELLFKVADGYPIGSGSDEIFGSKHTVMVLCRDMILLENQIPMCVLEHLLEIVVRSLSHGQSINLTKTAFAFFNNMMWREERLVMNYFNIKGKHFLDLLHKSFCDFGQEQGLEAPRENQLARISIRCATELDAAGVRFKQSTSLLDAKFENGVLQIPLLIINNHTNCLLRNLMAYEQSSGGEVNSYITSYAYLMNRLIDSRQDVAILVKNGIIANDLGNDGKVKLLFSNLTTGTTIKYFHYQNLCREVTKYMQQRVHGWRSDFMHNHFKTPWSVLSTCSVGILIIAGIISTAFVVASYFQKRS